jgi:gamma-glutamyltranspeptidase/glutathione hydrolase
VPAETRKALEAIGWKIGEASGAYGRYEGIEHRMQGDQRVYAAGSEMRADAVALAY